MVSTYLARCLAKICGDGYAYHRYLRYNNKSLVLLYEFKEDIQKEFGKIRFTKGRVNSGTPFLQIQDKKVITTFFAHLTSFKSDDIFIPFGVQQASLDVRLAFIRAFYDDEGSVVLRYYAKAREWKRNITLTSNSVRILIQIKEILKTIGIESNKLYRNAKDDRSYVLSITGKDNFILFKKNISFKHPRKALLLKFVLDSYTATPVRNSTYYRRLMEKLSLCRSLNG